MSYLRKDGKQYWVVAPECIGRDCLALGSYQHRAPVSGGGSRSTGSPDTLCCLTNAYRGCPAVRPYSTELAEQRRKEGIKGRVFELP